MNILRKLCCWCVLAQLAAVSVFAQAVNGTIVGTVSDATGAVIAGAKITLLEVNTGVTHSGQTNSAGFYNFPDLPPGTYNVTVEMSGLLFVNRKNIHVDGCSETLSLLFP